MMDKGIWKILVTSIILSLGIILLVVSPFIGVTGANPAGVGYVSGVALEAGMTSLEEEVGISAYANVGEKGKLTYTNAEYGFSIECPEDWAVNEGYMGFPVMFAGPIKDDFMINVIVEIEELPTKMTAYEYAKATKGQLSEEFKIVKTFNDTINGEPVSGIILTAPMEGGFWFKQMQAYFVSDTTAYILGFAAASSTYDEAEENYFDPMLRSFKFTEKEAGIEILVFIVTPSKVEAGEEVKIKFEAVNEADVEKTKTFFLLVSPPGTLPTETIDFKTVTLAPGEREEIEFTFIPKETGEHTLYVEDKFWVIAVDHEKEAGAESRAPTSGRWIGTTSEGKAVAFDVTNTQVNNFSISYSYSCSGSHGLRTIKLRNPQIEIIENEFQYVSHDIRIYGEFTSPNFATGTYRETWWDRTSPWWVTCDSGNITWNATKAEIYTGDTEPIVTASLGESVDNINLSWSTGGNAKWSWQNSTYYYGGDAAQSGTISHNQESWIQTTVSGPGTLSYYWNVSSEAKNDSLEFYIDDIWNDEISGSIGWQKKSYNLTPGIHTLKWSYMKDGRVNMSSDCGWLDKVEFAAVPTPPPASVTNLNESAVGTTWINWTWINPMDENFNHTMVYINGAFKAKVDKNTNYYKAIGLSPASIHTISTHTVDIWGNINQTGVNDTAMTKEAPDILVSPAEIKIALLQEEVEKRNLTLGNNGPGVLEFEVNATVKDWLSVYPSSGIIESGEQTNITVNLSANMLINGTYFGDIIVASNDPDESRLDIPVTLYVGRVVNESIYIDFDVTDAILSKDGKYIYLSSKPDYKLYIVNLTIGSVDNIGFSNMTESLTITPQGDAIYLALLTREHDAYWRDEDGHEGFIAEIDPDTRSLVKRFWINEDPYDIVATSDGYLYVSSGSGQYTYIRGYNLSTASEVGSAPIRHRSHIKLHPSENYIYSADTDISPSDIEKFSISHGGIQALYDSPYMHSPYHGDYPMCGDLEISPDGTKIFTKCGHIFRSTKSQSTDMTHIGTLGDAWNSLTFDEMNNIYTVSGTSVRKYNYDTYEVMGEKSINGNGRFVFYKNGYLIVITEDGDFPTKSSIQIIDASPAPPASVNSLNESAVGITWINWTWINPEDEEFNHTTVYMDGEF